MLGGIGLLLCGCGGGEEVTLLADQLGGGVLCVRAPAPDDVWVAGAAPSASEGPTLLHYDGSTWTALDTSAWAGGELWWVHPMADEIVAVGHEGLLLHGPPEGPLAGVDGPTAETTFFGVWGASADDVWAVGTVDDDEPHAVAWRRQGGDWTEVDLSGLTLGDSLFKVHGTAADDVWLVGSDGVALHWDGTALTATDTGHPTALLLTVDAGADPVLAVGGTGSALLLEWDGQAWSDVTPAFQPAYNGVCTGAGAAWVVGRTGARAERVDGSWITDQDRELQPAIRDDWHSCAIDSDGGLWMVGGRIGSRPLIDGVIGYQGPAEPPTWP